MKCCGKKNVGVFLSRECFVISLENFSSTQKLLARNLVSEFFYEVVIHTRHKTNLSIS